MKIGLDTNVLVSAAMFEGNERQLVDLVKNSYEAFLPRRVQHEFRRILATKFDLTPAEVADRARRVHLLAAPPEMTEVSHDEADREILAEAAQNGATFFVTGDRDMLGVKAVGAMGILKPVVLLRMLGIRA